MMKYLKLKSDRNNYISTILLLLVILLNISYLFASKPNFKISSSALYPRLNMVDTEEQIHWRSLLSYDQKFGSKFNIDGLFEFGSENNHFKDPFRVHHFTVDLKLRNHQFFLQSSPSRDNLYHKRISCLKESRYRPIYT